jgi:hypothetical protein
VASTAAFVRVIINAYFGRRRVGAVVPVAL